MDRLELNINKYKDSVRKQNQKLQAIKYKMDNETNSYIFETLEKSLEVAKKELVILNKNLDEEVKLLQREKAEYKKSLQKVKESLNDFYRISKGNLKIKRNVQTINDALMLIDKQILN